ncbi:MAG: hypothetical protein FD135_175 [Comamonadaceae bacterium]|nr:MAG: hypothetical protein FD135_175 [Comamonadaceae bacterium]
MFQRLCGERFATNHECINFVCIMPGPQRPLAIQGKDTVYFTTTAVLSVEVRPAPGV